MAISARAAMIRHVGKGLALAFLAGEWSKDALVERGAQAFGEQPPWLEGVVARVLGAFPVLPGDDAALVDLLCADERLARGLRRSGRRVRLRRWLIPQPTMVSVSGRPAGFPVPPVATAGELAGRLGVTPEELDWFADLRGLNPRARGRVLHYHYQWTGKASGGYRLLEAPSAGSRPSSVGACARCWRRSRSRRRRTGSSAGAGCGPSSRPTRARRWSSGSICRTSPSVCRARVAATLRRVGYPRAVARVLAGLCTAAAPELLRRRRGYTARPFPADDVLAGLTTARPTVIDS